MPPELHDPEPQEPLQKFATLNSILVADQQDKQQVNPDVFGGGGGGFRAIIDYAVAEMGRSGHVRAEEPRARALEGHRLGHPHLQQ